MFDQEEEVERAWRARWASTADAFARSTLLAREVSEHARRRRGVVEEARGEEMRSGVHVSCDATSDIVAHIDFWTQVP